jgi:hypothetical protein
MLHLLNLQGVFQALDLAREGFGALAGECICGDEQASGKGGSGG